MKKEKKRETNNRKGHKETNMAEEENPDDWQMMWGAKVRMPCDMPDNMLKFCIQSVGSELAECSDVQFEEEGVQIAERVKKQFDEEWGPSWHVVIGKNFGCYCTHESSTFVYFYYGDKACMIFKAGS